MRIQSGIYSVHLCRIQTSWRQNIPPCVLPGIRVILTIICFCAVKSKDMGVPACHNCPDGTH